MCSWIIDINTVSKEKWEREAVLDNETGEISNLSHINVVGDNI